MKLLSNLASIGGDNEEEQAKQALDVLSGRLAQLNVACYCMVKAIKDKEGNHARKAQRYAVFDVLEKYGLVERIRGECVEMMGD